MKFFCKGNNYYGTLINFYVKFGSLHYKYTKIQKYDNAIEQSKFLFLSCAKVLSDYLHINIKTESKIRNLLEY